MTFAAPLFLVAALAAAIPVVLHMIHRKRAVEVRFSTLRFLRLSVERTRRRKYLDDIGLLVLRAGALVLIAVGLAKPAVTSLAALRGRGATTAVAIILDNSASMALMDGGQPRFETARHAAEQVLDVLQDGDPVALLPTGGPPGPELGTLYHTHETVRQALAQCKVSCERADLAARLREARALLAEAGVSRREVYVITDNQALSWQGLKEQDEPPGRDEAAVVLVNLGRDPLPNAALRNLRLESPALAAGVPIRASVEVVNAALVPQQKHVELHVNGVKEAVSPTLTIPAGGAVKHEFSLTLDRGGVHRGEVRLAEEDGSPLDNRLCFALSIDRQIPVAIVKPRRAEIAQTDDAFYLERALAPTGADGWAVRATTLTAEQLATEPLAGYTVVFCVNLPAPDAAAAQRLRDYAWAGGHLFWIAGPNVQPDAYNRMSEQQGGQLLPLPLGEARQPEGKDDSRHIGSLDKEHPALAPLAEPASLYQSVLVHRYVTWKEDAQAQARPLARLDDGQPLLLERAAGSGSVLMLGTGVQGEWTNLPLKPLFLPLFARLTFHLAGAEADRSQVAAGAPLVIPLGGQSGTPEVEIVRPSGDVLRVRSPEANAQTFRYADTHDPGVYLLRLTGTASPRQFAFAVNMDPEECDPAVTTAEELKGRFGRHPFVVCDNPDDLAGTIHRLREGKSLWEVFLAAVLAGLVFEAFLANRVGEKLSAPAGERQGPAGTRGSPR
jgi:hypothetical protein